MNKFMASALLQDADTLLQLISSAHPDNILAPTLKDSFRAELIEAIDTLRARVSRAKREDGLVWHPLLGHIAANSVSGREIAAKSEAA